MNKIFSLQTLFQNILVLQISTMLSFVSCKQSIRRHIKTLLMKYVMFANMLCIKLMDNIPQQSYFGNNVSIQFNTSTKYGI